MRQAPHRHLASMHRQHGPFFDINAPLYTYLSTWEPDYVKYVLVTNNRNYRKDRATRKLSLLLGQGLLTSEGDFWRRQRRIAQPAFHRESLNHMFQAMVEESLALARRWQQGPERFDLSKEMTALTADIAARALFGANLQDEEGIGASLLVAMRYITRRFRTVFPLPLWLPVAENRAFWKAKKELDAHIHGMISLRREEGPGRQDLLDMLMHTEDAESGERMSDQQLRDEVITLFSAGHETSANGLNWTFLMLDRHPEVREQVEAEIAQVLAGGVPTAADIRKLSYTRQVLQEVMRLYPPAWAIGREPLSDDEVDGYALQKGSAIVMAPYAIHRNPDHWPDPEQFRPERFNPEQVKKRHKFAYLPFGGGPRLCIGKEFAMMEMLTVLAVLIPRFRLRVLPEPPIELEPLITLRPLHGISVQKTAL
jgi:cytochrome P450